jgi:hypothetical protein
MFQRSVLAALAAVAALAAPSLAAAQRLPLDFSQRPLTLPARVLRLNGDFTVQGVTVSVDTPAGRISQSNTLVGLGLGGGYGLTDDFEVGATLAPLTLSPEFQYNSPSAYGLFRIARGPTEIGLFGGVTIPTQSGAPLVFTLGAPALIRTQNGRLDLGIYFDVNIPDIEGVDPFTNTRIPVRFTQQLNPNLGIGLNTGVFVGNNFNFDTGYIPLGVFGQYTLQGVDGGPVADLIGSFDFNRFLNFSGDTVVANIWTIGLAARFYIAN